EQQGSQHRRREPGPRAQHRPGDDEEERERHGAPYPESPDEPRGERCSQGKAQHGKAREDADGRRGQRELGRDVADDGTQRGDRSAEVRREDEDRDEQQPAAAGEAELHPSNCRTTMRSRSASESRWAGSRPPSRLSSTARNSVIAASTRARPSSVSRTSTPRRSSGEGSRLTSPWLTIRSMRLVIVPEVTSVWVSSAPGERRYGGPARRNAARTSNSHDSRPERANAPRRARSRCRARRVTRESTVSGETSR